MLEKIIAFFKKEPTATKDQAPEGICPNCWGYHEYDQKVRAAYKDQQIDINNNKANHAFIQNFVVNNLSGITLVEKEEAWECPSCQVK